MNRFNKCNPNFFPCAFPISSDGATGAAGPTGLFVNAGGSVANGFNIPQTFGNLEKIDFTGGNFIINNVLWNGSDTFTILEAGLYYFIGELFSSPTQVGPVGVAVFANNIAVPPSFASGANFNSGNGNPAVGFGFRNMIIGDTVSLYNVSQQPITLGSDLNSMFFGARFSFFKIG
ncbi:TPA: hypothetical protein QCU53_005935 [Bacillus thuringiensis]|nr:hypothetical protein [Bacillus thuringiensis]